MFIVWNYPYAVVVLQVFILSNLKKPKFIIDIQTQRGISTDTRTFLNQQGIDLLVQCTWHVRRPCLALTGLPPLRTAWLSSFKDSDQPLNSLILLLEGNRRYSRRNSIVKILCFVLLTGKSSTTKIPGLFYQSESWAVCTQQTWVTSWAN